MDCEVSVVNGGVARTQQDLVVLKAIGMSILQPGDRMETAPHDDDGVHFASLMLR